VARELVSHQTAPAAKLASIETKIHFGRMTYALQLSSGTGIPGGSRSIIA
jgi:hypothetical protein